MRPTFEWALCGWNPDENDGELSEDESIMDLVLLATRTSQLRQGGMACVLVTPRDGPAGGARPLRDRIAVVATNRSLYGGTGGGGGGGNSDVHAEVAAVAEAARRGVPTLSATAYVTMPPCRRCFGALVAAGVRRVVSRYPVRCSAVQEAAGSRGVELSVQAETARQRDRVASLARDAGAAARARATHSQPPYPPGAGELRHGS
jgi:tRNA(Arg) A34 adenosine deaminase TadA